MASAFLEAGIGTAVGAILFLLASQPVPTITPEDAPEFEGQQVEVAGFAEEVKIGWEQHRGIIVREGHAIRFQADGTDAPANGEWVELAGVIERQGGRLVLVVEEPKWIH